VTKSKSKPKNADDIEGMELLSALSGARSEISAEEFRHARIHKGQEAVKISWKPVPAAETYDVTIFDTSDHSVVLQKEVEDTQLVFGVEGEKAGHLSYQVNAKLPSGTAIEGSELPLKLPLNLPLLAKPAKGAQVAGSRPVPLSWGKVKKADSYEVEVYADAGLKKAVLRKSSAQPALSFKPPKSGTYYWRVRASGAGRRSSWTEARPFQVKR
jgi:hypothetical protein